MKTNICAYQKNVYKNRLKKYWEQYLKKRISLNKKSYSIIPAHDEAKIYHDTSKKENRGVACVPEKEINIFGDTKVTGNIVAIMSQHEGRIFGILIRDSKFAKMFKDILKVLWKKYKA